MKIRFLRIPFILTVLGAAVAFTARGEWPWARLSSVPTALPIVVSDPYQIVRDTLQSGENLSTVLARHGVTGLDLGALSELLRFDPRRLRAGLAFSVHKNPITDEATRVEMRADRDQRVRFIRTSAGWSGESVPIRWTIDTLRVAAGIESSLYEAVDRELGDATGDQGERAKMVHELADVNAWTVDFSRDVQRGDRFAAVIERMSSEEGEVRFGQILASELHIGGKVLTAFRYTPEGGRPGFYDAEGRALKREFLAAPVKFRHVSSGFSNRRFHPVLGIYRKHEGIDYAANTGTPVFAASNGTVVRAGTAGGYGKMVEIRHRNGITTRYAHLSVIGSGVRPGRVVIQGEEIGKVGMTGTATGPHLHYEFRVNGVARDPRSIKMEGGEPLAPRDLPGFQQQRVMLGELLARGVNSASSAPVRALGD
jgi:murein DD-endopeptidase MepM/ murein hydrolase activator NlpD